WAPPNAGSNCMGFATVGARSADVGGCDGTGRRADDRRQTTDNGGSFRVVSRRLCGTMALGAHCRSHAARYDRHSSSVVVHSAKIAMPTCRVRAASSLSRPLRMPRTPERMFSADAWNFSAEPSSYVGTPMNT